MLLEPAGLLNKVRKWSQTWAVGEGLPGMMVLQMKDVTRRNSSLSSLQEGLVESGAQLHRRSACVGKGVESAADGWKILQDTKGPRS